MNKQNRFAGLAVTALLLSCSSAQLHAQMDNSSEQTAPLKKNANAQAEAKRLQEISVTTIHGDVAGKSPGFLSIDDGFFLTGDVFYWKAKQDNLDYVSRVTQVNSTDFATAVSDIQETIFEPHFQWDWGFRVDAGYLFGTNDDWEIDFIWTRFYDKAHSSVSTPNAILQRLFPSWGDFDIPATSASSRWTLHLNIYDLDFARNYFMSKFLSACPFVGLRGATIKQHYKVYYLGSSIFVLPNASSSMKARNNFWGIGPHLGTKLFWHFDSHWGLYGNIAASLLYGQFNVRQHFVEANQPISIVPVTQSDRNLWRVRTNIDLGTGLEWEFFFAKTMHMSLGIGYEISYWFKQLQLERINNFLDSATNAQIVDTQEENGDLGMQGWNFHVRYDF